MTSPKVGLDIREMLREISRRADEAGVDVRVYLDALIRASAERRREALLRRRRARKLKPS